MTSIRILNVVGGLTLIWTSIWPSTFASAQVVEWFRKRRAMVFEECETGALRVKASAETRARLIAAAPGLAAFMIGFTCMWIFGVHGMLSGTASMDFGGTKAASTVAGMLDGVQYLASGLTGFLLGHYLDKLGWAAWTWMIIPFSAIGAIAGLSFTIP